MLNWQSLQNLAFSLVRDDIREFAPKHREEVFYGFILDCDSFAGDLFPCLNTPEKLRDRATTYKHNLRSIAGPATTSNPYANRPIVEIEDELRWSPGDWGYLQINRWDTWKQQWNPVREKFEAARDAGESFSEDFMTMACRLVLQIEASGVLNQLKRTPDFTTLCADHDESVEVGRKRLAKVRAQEKKS